MCKQVHVRLCVNSHCLHASVQAHHLGVDLADLLDDHLCGENSLLIMTFNITSSLLEGTRNSDAYMDRDSNCLNSDQSFSQG